MVEVLQSGRCQMFPNVVSTLTSVWLNSYSYCWCLSLLVLFLLYLYLFLLWQVASGKRQAASGERACHQFDDLKIAP